MSHFTLHAPAKINLTLEILGKRADGFHEIDTLMVKLPGLSDTLDFNLSDHFSFTCDDPSLPIDSQNLVVKAAKAFEEKSGIPLNCSIFLKKAVPHGAGLGGGSSDAAATLLGLNRLFSFPLSASDLHVIASSIGSDIPFFLTAGASRCTGRGEKIDDVPSPPSLDLLLLKPSFSVSTPDAYKRWSASAEIPGISYEAQAVGPLSLVNQLERPVFEKHRFLAELKMWLQARSETTAALMSGSGSTVFAVLKEGANAHDLAECARSELDPSLWHWSGSTEFV